MSNVTLLAAFSCAKRNVSAVKDLMVRSLKIRNSSSLRAQEDVGRSVIAPDCFAFNERFKDGERKFNFVRDMKVIEDFVTDEEERSLVEEVEPQMKRLRYEKGHWDGAIENYREVEKPEWNNFNSDILRRVKELAFDEGDVPLKLVHVLDLKAEGVIKPHVDSVKFCGKTIAGLSLLSHSVMRLRLDADRKEFVDVLLKRRSLYIMTKSARYDFAHEILGNKESMFGGKVVEKGRRISVICRCEP